MADITGEPAGFALQGDDVIVHRRPGLIEAEVDGELVALHVDQGSCYGFNASATMLWAMIAEPRRLSEICGAITGEYDVSAADCEHDVRATFRQLEEDGLVRLEPVSAAG